MWLIISDTVANIDKHPDHYISLANNFEGVFNCSEDLIIKDVNRTLSCKDNPEHKESLTKVLYALARRNPEIGYLQGFNYMADFFLKQGFSEQECFWIMVFILEKLLHPQFYSSFFPLFADIKIFKVMLFNLDSEIFHYLTKNNLDLFLILHKWLFMHFMDVNNEAFISWFMDFFLMEAEVATMKTSMILFLSEPKQILKIKTVQDLKKYLIYKISNFSSEKDFKYSYKKFFLSEEIFKTVRKILIQKEKGKQK